MPPALTLTSEGRFARFEAIEWWDQELLRRARILVVGAGALGNEVIKNLSLLGVGQLVIVDMDRVEKSNLSRSVLYRERDEGELKAECAARAAREIYPGQRAVPLVGNVLADVGLGIFRWAQVVVGALDNREARVFVNSACARVGRPWVDGGIEVLQGIVRAFAPPGTACYECTMSQADWDLLNQRRSCSLLARRAVQQRGTPTTPTTASVIAGIQAQEVVKLLHGMDTLAGHGFVFEGASHNSYRTSYPIGPDCPWHEPVAAIEPALDLTSDAPVRELWQWAERRLGGVDALDLGRELVAEIACPKCQRRQTVYQAAEKIPEEQAVCRVCGEPSVLEFLHSITGDDKLLCRTIRQLGLPERDIVWARRGEQVLGIEIAGDRPAGIDFERSK